MCWSLLLGAPILLLTNKPLQGRAFARPCGRLIRPLPQHISIQTHEPAGFHGVERPWEPVVYILVLNVRDVGIRASGVAHDCGSVSDHDPGEWILAVERQVRPPWPRIEQLVIDLLRARVR